MNVISPPTKPNRIFYSPFRLQVYNLVNFQTSSFPWRYEGAKQLYCPASPYQILNAWQQLYQTFSYIRYWVKMKHVNILLFTRWLLGNFVPLNSLRLVPGSLGSRASFQHYCRTPVKAEMSWHVWSINNVVENLCRMLSGHDEGTESLYPRVWPERRLCVCPPFCVINRIQLWLVKRYKREERIILYGERGQREPKHWCNSCLDFVLFFLLARNLNNWHFAAYVYRHSLLNQQRESMIIPTSSPLFVKLGSFIFVYCSTFWWPKFKRADHPKSPQRLVQIIGGRLVKQMFSFQPRPA